MLSSATMDAVLCRLPSGLALLYHTSGVGGMLGPNETPASQHTSPRHRGGARTRAPSGGESGSPPTRYTAPRHALGRARSCVLLMRAPRVGRLGSTHLVIQGCPIAESTSHMVGTLGPAQGNMARVRVIAHGTAHQLN